MLGLQNPDYEIEPWTPADSVAWLKAMAWDLRTNIEDETERAIDRAGLHVRRRSTELYPDYPFDRNPVIVPTISSPRRRSPPSIATTPDDAEASPTASVEWYEVDGVIEAVSALVGGVGEGIGSNSWVVSGDLTESGMPLLANDPHLGAVAAERVAPGRPASAAPSRPDCPFDVAGFGFSGVPGVVIGHNDRIAWGFTNLTTDVTDLYLEKIQGDSVLARRRARAARGAHRDPQGRRRRRRRAHHPLDRARPDHLGPDRRLRRDRRRPVHRHRRHR